MRLAFRDFIFWYLPQIQYKNPNVQIVSFKNMTPTPFIRCFYGNFIIAFPVIANIYICYLNPFPFDFIDNGKEIVIDIDSKKKEEILSHCLQTIGKSR